MNFGLINFCFVLGYFDGLVENLHLMPVYYKGWVMRLYHDFSASDPVMKVMKGGKEIDFAQKYFITINNSI